MVNNYFLNLKGPKASAIRERLKALKERTLQAHMQAQHDLKRAYFEGLKNVESGQVEYASAEARVFEAEERVYNLEKQLENLSFRLSLVTEPTCRYCGSTWGLSQELDLRYSVSLEKALRGGCFWCCGYCYAHVLHAAYSNLPEMKGK